MSGAGNIAEDYEEDTDEDGYLTEDSVDPDNMTYEVCIHHSCLEALVRAT